MITMLLAGVIYDCPGALNGFQLASPRVFQGVAVDDDVVLRHRGSVSELVANPLQRNVNLTAGAEIRFADGLPDGGAIRRGAFRFVCDARLLRAPRREGAGYGGETVSIAIRMSPLGYRTWQVGELQWVVNPRRADYGHILLVGNDGSSAKTMDTGVVARPDTEWRKFGVEVDFNRATYTSVTVDGYTKPTKRIELTSEPVANPIAGAGAFELTVAASNAKDAPRSEVAVEWRNARLLRVQ